MDLDTSFDFRADAGGRDPDTHSATLRRYHQFLWSKPLPGGTHFELDVVTPGEYLHHRSALGEFFLSSDSVIPTWDYWPRMQPVVGQLEPQEIETFVGATTTIGGMVIFPSNRIDGRPTMNGARGMTRKIADRFDLTLECIRRHYRGEESPLSATLDRYKVFFALFDDFTGYVDFFLLQDLVDPSAGSVRFFMPFDDFSGPAVPETVAGYRSYARLSMDFIESRNLRIARWARSSL